MWPTDYPTDQAMDWLTNRVIYRVLCTQLKKRTLGVDGALVGVEEDDNGRGDGEKEDEDGANVQKRRQRSVAVVGVVVCRLRWSFRLTHRLRILELHIE